MCSASNKDGGRVPPNKAPAFRYLVESALMEVAGRRDIVPPKDRRAWLDMLCDALVAGSESSYQRVIASMVANGIPEDAIFENYLPDVAAMLGERWVQDSASFVEVAIGAARLQDFIRTRENTEQRVRERLIPLGQSILMVIPVFEQHGLGVFIAANQFRRHGLWTHVSIGLDADEIVEQLSRRRFAMVGITIGSDKSVEKSGGLIQHLRENVVDCPPVVIGGRAVQEGDRIQERTKADVVANSAREAIDRLGLASFVDPLLAEQQD